MRAAIIRYDETPLALRLLAATGAVIFLNAVYCLAYTYSAGRPSTLADAFAWGTINLAPWVAAFELGRHTRRALSVALLIGGAFMLSMALDAAYWQRTPGVFEAVRRIPGAVLTVAMLAGLGLWRQRQAGAAAQGDMGELTGLRCEWVRAAGNYVEVKYRGQPPRMQRSTLAQFVSKRGDRLLRIHRSFAIAPEAIERCERQHVRLKDGTRLPIGNAFRGSLDLI